MEMGRGSRNQEGGITHGLFLGPQSLYTGEDMSWR